MPDTIGFRQRLTVAYARPLFFEMGQIRAACQKLPPETKGKPAVFIAFCLYPLIVWSLRNEVEAGARGVPEGAIFKPSDRDGARCLVDEKFNVRNMKQAHYFLEAGQHDVSKHNGKLKTKYDRMLVGVQQLNALTNHFRDMQARGVAMYSPDYATFV